MSREIPMTEASLRKAMADERYWKPSHPERPAYVGWVTEGWQALSQPAAKTENGQAVVFVRAYDRSRGGKQHHVGAYTRSAPDHAEGARVSEVRTGTGGSQAMHGMTQQVREARVVPVQLGPMLMAPKPPNIMPRPGVGSRPSNTPEVPRGEPMRRVPHQSGKEGATNIPDWARGFPRFRGEEPGQFAERLMNDRYGRGNWGQTREQRGPGSKYQRIKKFGQRAFHEEILSIFGYDLEEEA